ncbi:MAG: hypothetical protein RLZZ352_436 [Pseudomonadota bacterium]
MKHSLKTPTPMPRKCSTLPALLLLPALLTGPQVWAQHTHDHGTVPATAQTSSAPSVDERPWVGAELRRIDAVAGKVTLKHGEIRNLDMPPMTMVFTLREKALLGTLKAGDRVRFQADQINGVYTVLALEALP